MALQQLRYVTLEELHPYPRLSYEQGEHNSFYFSEEILSTLDSKKDILVRDRATLFNLLTGLNGYTICSGSASAPSAALPPARSAISSPSRSSGTSSSW